MKTWTVTFSVDEDKRLKIETSGTEEGFKNIEKMGMLEILKHNLVRDSILNRDKETR